MRQIYKVSCSLLVAILTVSAGCSAPGPEVKDASRQDSSHESLKIIQLPANSPLAAAELDESAIGANMNVEPAMPFPGRQALLQYGIQFPAEPVDRENYAHVEGNPVRRAAEFPVSTFSIDVDTGSYANVRRMLRAGRLPVQDAVRVEELVNYFSYDYPRPKDPDQPFLATTEIAPAPWNPDTYLLQVGIQGYEVKSESLPPANLVFLVDVSGSMQSADKLGLLKSALKLLTRKLRAVDHVAIAVYAGASGVVLEPTTGNRQFRIRQAIESLQAGGSTNGAAGIALAYELAAKSFQPNGVNRVLLATDGDFNVGTVDFDALIDMVEARRKSGIALTTLGFGTGNYNDHLMEQLADAGNGNHAYIDTLQEAQKVLVDEAASTLHTIARDVKIQIEFNPALVSEYRLIGYENRLLNREDFNNDRVDAGEIGAGHSVTALYEVALAGRGGERVDPLRYAVQSQAEARNVQEVAMLRIRYKTVVDGEASRLIETPVLRDSVISEISGASGRFRFAAAVAAFAQHLRGGTYLERFGYPEIGDLARNARGRDRSGYRGEFLQLLALAQSLDTAPSVQAHATAD